MDIGALAYYKQVICGECRHSHECVQDEVIMVKAIPQGIALSCATHDEERKAEQEQK